MFKPSRIALVAVALLGSNVPTAPAQERGHLWWLVSPVDAYPKGDTAGFDLFEPGSEIELRVIVKDEAGPGAVRVGPGYFSGLVVALRRDSASVSATTEWRDVVEISTESGHVHASRQAELVLQPGEWVTGHLVLTAADPLRPGDYELAVDGRESIKHVRTSNGGPWSGNFAHTDTIPIRVNELDTPGNRIKANHLRAQKALQARDAKQAVLHYEAALKERPVDFHTLSGLGRAYFALGDYRKSVDAFEKARPLLSSTGRTTLHYELACAYVGLEDRVNARRVLGPRVREADVTRALAACDAQIRARGRR